MTQEEVLHRMFGTRQQPPNHYITGPGYGAWVEGLLGLASELGLRLYVTTDMDGNRKVSSYASARQLIASGVEPEQILALYVLCFEA
jgi:hypothetical protein